MLDIPLPSPEAHDVERPLTAHAPSDRVEEELGWARGRVAGAVLLLWLWCLDRGAVTSDRHHARSSITGSGRTTTVRRMLLSSPKRTTEIVSDQSRASGKEGEREQRGIRWMMGWKSRPREALSPRHQRNGRKRDRLDARTGGRKNSRG